MSRFHTLAVTGLLVLILMPTGAIAQPSYGSPTGRVFLSFNPTTEESCGTAPAFQAFSLYVMAEIDFGDPGRNAADGLSAFELQLSYDSNMILLSTLLPGPFSVNLGGSTATTLEMIVGMGECLPVDGGPFVLAEVQFLTLGTLSDLSFDLGPIPNSSFALAPSGDAPGWVECLPFDEVRFPFASWSGAILNPTLPGVATDLEPAALSASTLVECSDLQVQYTLRENELCAQGASFDIEFWLSDDAVIEPTDTLLLTDTIVGGLGGSGLLGGSATLTLPNDPFPDDVYIGLVVDPTNAIGESDEGNNVIVIGPEPITGHRIRSIADVGSDQGLQLRINFRGSPFDVLGSATPILQYEAFRRIDGGSKHASTELPGRMSVATPGYEFVGAIPAHGESEYNIVVPTVQDGAATGFFIRAATASPLVYYDDCEIEGTSIDNLAPPPPAPFAVAYEASGNNLNWTGVDAPDLVGFRVYRDTNPGFVPGPANLVLTTSELSWFDPVANAFGQSYKVASFDDGQNESPAIDPTTVTGTGPDGNVPARFALSANVPNPFNPSTVIRFDVPRDAGQLRLEVYDLAGRAVRELFAGTLPAGSHHVQWDGVDSAGHSVASGTYFFRLAAREFTATRKMTLLK